MVNLRSVLSLAIRRFRSSSSFALEDMMLAFEAIGLDVPGECDASLRARLETMDNLVCHHSCLSSGGQRHACTGMK